MAAPQQESPGSAQEVSDDAKTTSKIDVKQPETPTTAKEAPTGSSDDNCNENKVGAPQSSSATTTTTVAAAKISPPNSHNTNPPAIGEDLTYAGTESSDTFLLAKRLLNDGDFDNAMSTLGEAMRKLMSVLPADSEAQLHQSMGPLYYLYGTTLLYSIEESTDNLQTGTEDENEADDSQIAWENLEAARAILDNLVNSNDSNDDQKTNQNLKLDLAQIHLRLGDLQRYNGRYHDAVTDYQTCLEIREPILGMNNRKVADTHYNLGLVYLMLASEGDKKEQEEQPQTPKISAQLREEYRKKGITHYLAAGKCFAGIIAFHCGVDSETIIASTTGAEASLGGGKTTGMNESELEFSNISHTLKVIRSRVAPLQSSSEQAMIDDLKEILDEIQETIDEAHTAKQAISEVSEMKAQAKAAAEGDGEVTNADGSTTSIGFGTASAKEAIPERPMMMVRRKKKRDEESVMELETKKPKSE